MAVIASDDFTRADGAIGTAPTGQVWTALSGAWSVLTNQARSTTNTSVAVALDLGAGKTDHAITAKIAVMPAASNTAGVIGRCVDDANYYLADVTSTGAMRLFKKVAGTFTQFGSDSAAVFVAGDEISLQAVGPDIVVYRNRTTLMFTVTDSALSTGTKAGFRKGGADVTMRWDDFEGADPIFALTTVSLSGTGAIAVSPASSAVTIASSLIGTGAIAVTGNSSALQVNNLLASWEGDTANPNETSQRSRLRISTTAVLSVDSPPVAPPEGAYVVMSQVNQVMPTPGIDEYGQPMDIRNLLDPYNSDFEVGQYPGTLSWAGANATTSVVTPAGGAASGTRALAVTSTISDNGNTFGLPLDPAGTAKGFMRAYPGTSYTLTGKAKAATLGRPVAFWVAFYTEDGLTQPTGGTIFGTTTTTNTSTWTTVPSLTALAPAGAYWMLPFVVSGQNTVVGDVQWWDQLDIRATTAFIPAETRRSWGRPRLMVGNEDITYYRGVPTQVNSWASTDPFDDSAMSFTLPQVSAFEAWPGFLNRQSGMPDVEIQLVRANWAKNPWFGFDSNGDGLSDSWASVYGTGTYSRSTTSMPSGITGYRQTFTLTAYQGVAPRLYNIGIENWPVRPDFTYTVSGYIRANAAASYSVGFKTLDAAGNTVTDQSSTGALSANVWTRVSYSGSTAAGSVKLSQASLGISGIAPGYVGGLIVDIAGFQFEEGLTASAWTNLGGTQTLWEGMVMSKEPDENGLTVHCVGALYQLDLYLAQPDVYASDTPVDMGKKISDQFKSRPGLRTGGCNNVTTSILTRQSGGWDKALTGYVETLLANSAYLDGSGFYLGTWTLLKNTGRIPVIKQRDLSTVHWTVAFGTPGIEMSMAWDNTQAPNTWYGEGTNPEGCHWRNAKYPNLHPDNAPVWGGTTLTMGAGGTSNDAWLWRNRMADKGWGIARSNVNSLTAAEDRVTRSFQSQAGIQVDGDVAAQTWAATFETGSNAGSFDGAFFMPLVVSPSVEPYIYSANGGIISDNPAFDRQVPRIERHYNYGEMITKEEATALANQEWQRDYIPWWTGRITLKADPQSGSRFEMKAGQNIQVKYWQGQATTLLHIVGCEVDLFNGTTTLTVDQRGRDLMTVAAIRERQFEATDPSRNKRVQYRNSRITEDRRSVWDCEAGGGIIPRHGVYQRLWNVLRIPMAQLGSVVRSEFTVYGSPYTTTPLAISADSPLMAYGVFDKPITANLMAARGDVDTIEGYWDLFDESTGLLIAWGDSDQMAGFYPGIQSEGDPPTGRFVDNASWYYETVHSPWLWVAIWCNETAWVEGRFFPDVAR